MHEKTLVIALELGVRAAEGAAYCNLGNAYISLGQFHKAIEMHEKELAIALELGDRAGEGRAYVNLGIVYELAGQPDKAQEMRQAASRLA